MTRKDIESEYLATIEPYLQPAKDGDEQAIIALEKNDEEFWKWHNLHIYELIQKLKTN